MKAGENKPDWEYPRTYRIDQSTHRFFEEFAIFLAALFRVTTCLHLMGVFARPLSHRDLAWSDLFIALIAISFVWWANQHVVLYEHAIELTGWFETREMKREEIRGIRMGRLPISAGGGSYYIVVSADRRQRELKLPPFLS